MRWELIGEIHEVETIAAGRQLKVRKRLVKRHGRGRWRKCKGIGSVRLSDGSIRRAELHWYEATGFGRRELKIKRLMGDKV